MLTKIEKLNALKKARLHDNDTGSAEAQISILTRKIDDLAQHLKKNTKDKHSRRGLLQMVADRRKHLIYLKKKDVKRYEGINKKLGLKNK